MKGNRKKWLGTKKNGWERKKMKGNGKKWLGTKKNGWEREKMVGNGKKWLGTKKNEGEREKMTCTGNCQGRGEVSSPVILAWRHISYMIISLILSPF
jgi:hypothetical protein